MENVGDWLYIVLLAIAGISSLLNSGKKKKKKEASMQPPERPVIVNSESASDRDFWETILEPEEFRQPQPSPVRTSKKKIQKKAQPVTTTSPSPFLQGESDIERAIRLQGAAGIFKEEENPPQLVNPEEFHDPETLRKAVIYTEILNRRY